MPKFLSMFAKGPLWRTPGAGWQVGSVDLGSGVAPLRGRPVRLAIHMLPPSPPDPTRWGGGCCLWERLGVACPAGHHVDPLHLLSIEGAGVLAGEPGWSLDEGRVQIPMGQLEGHEIRVAVATLDPDPEEDPGVAALKGRLSELEQALSALRRP